MLTATTIWAPLLITFHPITYFSNIYELVELVSGTFYIIRYIFNWMSFLISSQNSGHPNLPALEIYEIWQVRINVCHKLQVNYNCSVCFLPSMKAISSQLSKLLMHRTVLCHTHRTVYFPRHPQSDCTPHWLHPRVLLTHIREDALPEPNCCRHGRSVRRIPLNPPTEWTPSPPSQRFLHGGSERWNKIMRSLQRDCNRSAFPWNISRVGKNDPPRSTRWCTVVSLHTKVGQ